MHIKRVYILIDILILSDVLVVISSEQWMIRVTA